MQIVYDEIRLDPAAKSIAVVDDDWIINPARHCLQHNPTRTIFVIRIDEKETEGAPLLSTDFSAHLVGLSEGRALPPPEEIEALAARPSLSIWSPSAM